uniref:Uncharacterized protein n=1 Tax=Glossina palpalis gambiensis TaxID=67801 RepID=A0A1B0BP93_9MUSC
EDDFDEVDSVEVPVKTEQSLKSNEVVNHNDSIRQSKRNRNFCNKLYVYIIEFEVAPAIVNKDVSRDVQDFHDIYNSSKWSKTGGNADGNVIGVPNPSDESRRTALCETGRLKSLLQNLKASTGEPIAIYDDNRRCATMACNQKSKRPKLINIRRHFDSPSESWF